MKRDYAKLGIGGLASKILGGVREILLARYFGTGQVADAYRASLSVTLSPAHLVTTRVIQTCFIPLYARYSTGEREKGWALFQSLLLLFLVLGTALGVLLFLFAGPIIGAILRGFDPDRAALAVRMLRIMAIGVPFYVYSSVLGALGSAQRDFVIPAVRPGLQNLCMLILIVAAALSGRPALAAFGFTAAYALLSLYATAHLLRRNRLPIRPSLDRGLVREVWARLWELLRPLVFLSFLVEAGVLIERAVASLLGPGRVAAVDYARYVTETVHFLLAVPIGIIGLSVFANLSEEEMRLKIDRILSLLAIAILPLSAFLLLNGRDVLAVLYMRGRFDATSLHLTERALWGFSIGLWAFSASYSLQRILNARMRNAVVLRAETLAIVVNAAVLFLLYRRLGVFVIGLGVTLGSIGSLLAYLSYLRISLPLTKKSVATALLAMPLYLLLAWAGLRLLGRGLGPLVLQSLFVFLFWSAVVFSFKDLRRLVLDQIGGGGR
ncbi:MAG: lipid II flippase MurJ [Candidatus Eisenbacteria bacterium]